VIRTAWFVVVTFLSTLFFSLTAVVGGLVRAGRGWYDWVHRNWARSLLWAAGVRVEAQGVEHVRPGEAHLFVSNHQSLFDVWAMMAVLPVSLRFVTKKELGRIPIFGAACRSAGHVFIDRANPTVASEAIRAAGKRMERDGLSLVLFPEGTRSPDGRLKRFKKGAFALAIETQADLVPIGIDGGGALLPRGARRVRPGVIRLRCAARVPLRGMTAADRDALVERTRDTVGQLLERLRGEPGGHDPRSTA
jgi:1-acyl-sn-glycerol-3-phosphate acyltransferase